MVNQSWAERPTQQKGNKMKKNKKRKQGQEPTDNGSDMLRTTGMVSKMFGLLSNDMDKSKQLDQKKRFFEISGLTFPDNWDSLPIKEKEKRINQVENFAIDQHDLHAIKQGEK